jgi:CheY-like chemotaxis protein
MRLNPLFHPFAGSDPLAEPSCAGPEFAKQYPLRILIADDNYINRRVLSLLLQRLGYEAVTTENGRDCLNAALQAPYDLLLVDVNMPEMNGIECAQQLRLSGHTFPIVAVTATDPEATRRPCFDAGMNDFICKPVQLPELKRVLRESSQLGGSPISKPRTAESDGRSEADVGYRTLHFVL